MKNNRIRITESELKQIVAESVKKVLNEISSDTVISANKKEQNDFKPNGYKASSAFGGYEMELDDRGEMARLRNSHTGKVSEWLNIQFDENGVAYVIDENGDEERLCDYMHY